MSGSASGTTRSAVADGTVTVRDAQHQTQDVTVLSRDTENANGRIDKIFDKEKVNNQMAFAQGVQQLAGNIYGDVKAWKLNAAAKETSERLLSEHPDMPASHRISSAQSCRATRATKRRRRSGARAAPIRWWRPRWRARWAG